MNAYPRILMCRPEYYGILYEINPWMNVKSGADPERSRAQWQRLRDTLEQMGARIELIDPVPGLPDLVFTANAGLVFRNQVLISRFRFGVRQKEEPHFARWFAEHGFTVGTLPEGDYFEGAGDALFCGETLFAGYRFRSNARSHQWIGEHLGVRVLPLELVDPRFYHLDTCFCPLSTESALYYPGAFDDYGRAVLKAHIPDLIEVSGEEATSFSCNAVVVGRSVAMNDAAPKLATALLDRGYAVHRCPLGEFIKSGGSAKCLTLRLDGEDSAAWRLQGETDSSTGAAAS